MRAELFSLLTGDRGDDYSLAQLARAIARAKRTSTIFVWRIFVRSHGERFVPQARTQRITAR